ncbi:MAG TPA: SDR family oxidoreductase [Candidatus Polarisedimenticolia bacterium]|nr:SDR family oxidoreductase [Candidatus Polarisedimenticolia bacterium]
MTTRRYLVTGGAGFIGSHIVETLIRSGESVVVLDDFSTGKRENLDEVRRATAPHGSQPQVIEGDIRDPGTVRRAMAGVTHVLHQAALGSVPRSVADPSESHDVNATGTLNLLVAARDEGVRRFVYASSSSIYGDSEVLPKVESMAPAPLSPYAVNKLAAELYCGVFHRLYGLETVSLRYFNIFGPRQDPNSQYAAVVPKFITAALQGKAPIIYGDGLQSRDFTYIDNAVQANLKACEAPAEALGRAYNIACGSRATLLDVIEVLGDLCGSDLEPRHEESRPGDVKHSMAGIDLAKRHLGYEPGTGLREGLRRTIDWFRA